METRVVAEVATRPPFAKETSNEAARPFYNALHHIWFPDISPSKIESDTESMLLYIHRASEQVRVE
jgi:hypothetical protein